MKKSIIMSLLLIIMLSSCSLPFPAQKNNDVSNSLINKVAEVLDANIVKESKTYSDPLRGFEMSYPANLSVRDEKDAAFFSEQVGDKQVEQIIISHGLDKEPYLTPNSPDVSENKVIGGRGFFIQKDTAFYDVYYPSDLEIEILISPQYKSQAETILRTLKNTFIHEEYDTEAVAGVFALGYIHLSKSEEYAPVIAVYRPNQEKIGIYAINGGQLQDISSELPAGGFKGDISSAVLSYDGEKLAFVDDTVEGKEVIKIINLTNKSEKTLAQPLPDSPKRIINKLLVWDNKSKNILAVAYVNDKERANVVYSVSIDNDEVVEIFGEYDYKGEPEMLSLRPVGFSADGNDFFFSYISNDGTIRPTCGYFISHIESDSVNDTSRIKAVFRIDLDKSYCDKPGYNNIVLAKFVPKTSDLAFWRSDEYQNSIYLSKHKTWEYSQPEQLAEPKWKLHSGLDMKFALSGDGKNLLFIQSYGDVGFAGTQVYNYDIISKESALLYQVDTSWMP